MIIFKIMLLGDSSVGKTAFILRFCDGKFEDDCITTIGLDTKTKFVTHKEKKIQLQIWDTAGEERFRSIAKSCYKGADGILLMYDVSNINSFKHIKNWIGDIENNITVPKDKLALIIIGNKSDLPEDQKKVDNKDREDFQNKYKYKIIEASAKTDTNINESIMALIDKMLDLGLGKIKNNDNDDEDDNQKLSNKKKKKKGGLC